MDDIAKIAAGLSEAERAALASTDTAKPGELVPLEYSAACLELLRMRLLGIKPTPLGIAVRDYLRSKNDG